MTSSNSATTRAQQVSDVVDLFVAALDSGDLDLAKSYFTPDGVVWHNYDEQPMPCGAALAVLEGAAGAGMDYEITWRYTVDDGCVQQHVVRGHGPGGELVTMPVMWRVVCDGDRIHRVDEYFDTAQGAAILAAARQITGASVTP